MVKYVYLGMNWRKGCKLYEGAVAGKLMRFSGLLPVFGRGKPLVFVKNTAEVQRIVIPYDPPNLRHRVGGGLQKHLCVGHADGDNVLKGRSLCVLFKIADKPADTHTPGGSVFFSV